MRLSFFILFLAAALYAAPLRGVIVEETTDRPIPHVNITYISGKVLGQSDSRGRFEFTLDSKNAVLLFKKAGFDSTLAEMQDFADLLDVVVTMRSNARHLGSATI
ncbi:MAG: carboxypeptidase-like regulatory domain-containing protein, partial [Fibromonadales bacterium]|nr:carboxypeptidase-like regulatory domain-containing protein [Fibromonadales bacterium]